MAVDGALSVSGQTDGDTGRVINIPHWIRHPVRCFRCLSGEEGGTKGALLVALRLPLILSALAVLAVLRRHRL